MDLVALVADKNMEHALRGIFSRPEALGVRPFSFEILRHPEHDPGCRQNSSLILGSISPAPHALVILDLDGSGSEEAELIEREIASDIRNCGWQDAKIGVVIIQPELESWIWSDSPHVPSNIGWNGDIQSMRSWLEAAGFGLADGTKKPLRPKEALQAVLRQKRRPRSSSLYFEIASTVSLSRCIDPAFVHLRTTLRSWFPL